MKISIITVCRNSEKYIEDAILSVASQIGVEIEHIIVDGVSTDNTLNIIKRYDEKIIYISEPDQGIYDAMNKGLAMATGDIIGTLNSDDLYMNEHVLQHVAEAFNHRQIDACYADLIYVSQFNVQKVVRYWRSRKYMDGLFKLGWMPAHPTFFARKEVYTKYGSFDLKYKIAADFELLFRFIEQSRIKAEYIPFALVKMRLGGTTNKSFSNIYKQNKEIISILRSNYLNFSLINFLLHKLYIRVLQFLTR